MIKRIIFSLLLLASFLEGYSQNNSGSPYSVYGFGYMPDNNGTYTAMGGVTAAMRDNKNINFLNPASYTSLDSNRFYFQFSFAGEYVDISTHDESASYQVAQNANLNMALRLRPDLFFSFGFTEKSKIGYDLLYSYQMSGSANTYFNQNISGEGGLNDLYAGFGWKYKNLSVGINFSYVFGKIEKRQSLIPQFSGPVSGSGSYYIINTSENNRVDGVLFNPGLQYEFKLSPKSQLTLGTSMNFSQNIAARKDFIAFKVNPVTGNSSMLKEETEAHGYILYPLRIVSGFDYQYKNKWQIAGDYTFQQMSDYEEFDENQGLKNYHKASLGASWTPEALGRFWWQRNKYMAGAYFVKSSIDLRNTNINTYGLTLGSQIPFITRRGSELTLGVALDMGLRGSEKRGVVQEKFAKVRVNISFKEIWFMKRKIN